VKPSFIFNFCAREVAMGRVWAKIGIKLIS
jgi:hypothetical protein